jgi:hypothetical protein
MTQHVILLAAVWLLQTEKKQAARITERPEETF